MGESTAIVEGSDVFMEMDRRDQLQIVAEAMGEIVDELVYVVDGKKGLSYKGVNTIGFYMGDIGVEPWVDWHRFQMGEGMYWGATVRAYNERYNLTSLGTAEVPEMMEVYDRDDKKQRIPDGHGGFKTHLEFDRFCRRKALSMAQRNAKRAVMPEAMISKWLTYFWDKKQGRDVELPFKPKVVDADYAVITKETSKAAGKPTKKTTPKQKPTKKTPAKKPSRKKGQTELPEETPQEDPNEERVRLTLEANGVDLKDLEIVKYGDRVQITVLEDYDQIRWVDDQKVITKMLDGKWISEKDRWEVPLQ